MSQVYFNRTGTLGSLVVDGNTGSATPAGGVLNIVGNSPISTAASGNTVTISIASGGFTWIPATSTLPANPIMLSKNTGYICEGGALVTFLLPSVAAVGDTFQIMSSDISGDTPWTVTQGASQSIRVAMNKTTPGVLGSLSSTNVGDVLEIVCIAANLEFQTSDSTGNFTFV
jgi:hypothetical protein